MSSAQLFDSIWQDARYALRLVRVNPAFAVVAILSIALGAGANTAMFQLLDAVRLRTLPVAAPQELVDVRLADMTHARGAWLREGGLTHPLWEQTRRDQDVFSTAFAWADEPLDISSAGQTRKITSLWVSGDFFRALGVEPAIGRLFGSGDDHRGCGRESGVVLSYRFWQQEYGGDRSIVGRDVAIGKFRSPVVGVTPPAFFGLEVGRTFDVAMPICAEPAWHGVNARLDSGTVWWLTVMGRLKPGVTLEQAAAHLRTQSPQIFRATLPAGYPAASVKPYLDMQLVTSSAERGVSRVRALYSGPLVLLFGITGVVLLIACVNLAHLMLARANTRGRELAVRVSLGASGRRLAQQLIVESLMLAAAGVATGLVLAGALSRFLVSFLATDGSNVFLDLSLNARTFAFAAILALLTCIIFASLPALRAARTQPAAALKTGGAGTPTRERAHVRQLLLASQIALSLALLMGTVLFVRSLRNLNSVDAGFDRHGIVIADINFADRQLPADRAVSFRREMLEQLRAKPGIEAASEALIPPLSGGNWNNRIWMDDSDAQHARVVMRNMIGTDFFRTLRTPMVAGRDFTDRDFTASAAKVAIVNEAFVRQFALASPAIGRHFSIEPTPLEPTAAYEIVGVVANAKYRDLREDDQPIMYVPLWQSALRRPAGQFVIRSSAPAAALISTVRATLAGLGQLRYSFRTYDALVQDSLLRERLMATVSVPFGTLAIVLTALGLYGVFSFIVAQRTHDIGIRIALGATRRDVTAPILGETLVLVAIGVAGGSLMTVAAGRAVAALLFAMKPYDPLSLGAAGVAVALVALFASYLPARRAARIDPVVALRHE